MSRAIVHVTMSLDGYIAGPNDEMDWIFRYVGDTSKELETEVIERTGATLGGRHAYDVGRRGERPEMRKLFGGRWEGPQFILTHDAPTDEQDPSLTFISGDIQTAMRTAQTAAAGRDVLVLGASIVNQCLEAGLVDEILIQLVPELLGDGVRLFGATSVPIRLQTIDATRSGQVVNARFHVHGTTRTDAATRVIAASPDRVYAALVDPEALVTWLPPDGMSGKFERFDARPGGSYRLVLTYADPFAARGKATASSDIIEVRFVDLVPVVRLVQAADFVSDDPVNAGTMTLTWDLTAVQAGTRVDVRADDVPAGITAEDHAAGLASSLANLAAYLER